MSFPEFGRVIEEGKGGEFPEYGEVVPNPSRARSLISAPIKGLFQGIQDVASQSLTHVPGPIGPKLQKKLLDKLLPTKEKALEGGLERAGRLAPLTLGGGESLLAKGIRTGVGAIGGEALKQAGAPEWAQSLAELSAFMAPKLSGKLQPKPSQKEAVEFLRGKGLTDKEITPLLQEEKRLRRLAPYAHKGERTRESLAGAHEKLGQGYQNIKKEGKELASGLNRQQSKEFTSKIEDKLEDISPDFQRLIKDNLKDIRNKEITFNRLYDFYQDINRKIKGVEGGKAVLGILKEPILEGLRDINPRLAKDFESINRFYAKKSQVAGILSPRQVEDLLDLGESYGALVGIATADPGLIAKTLGLIGGRAITEQLLTNPRLQNLSNQMLKAIKDNKLPLARKFLQVFKKELSKKDKESADLISLEDME